MTREQLRFWLLTGLNILAGLAALFLAFDEWQATRGLVDDGIVVLFVLAAFILVPLVSLAIYVLGRKSGEERRSGRRVYRRISLAFLTLCWLTIASPGLFWGLMITAAREPWPLSLAQGPDTDRAREGAEKMFGASTAQSMSSVYLFSFNLRDSSYFVRFDFDDQSVIDQVAEAKDMVKAPVTARDDGRFDLRAHEDRFSWWKPDDINRSNTIYVDRLTGEKIAGSVPRNEPTGVSRVLWVNDKARVAHYREIEF